MPSRKCWQDKLDFLASGPAAAALASAATAGTTATAATFAWHHRTGFVHHQRAAQQVAAVASFDCAVSGGVVVDFDEPESASLTGKTIAHYIHAIHGNTRLREEIR
jgi:hypothetical protein